MACLFARLINLVEDAAIGEVRLLRLLPAAEQLIHREQADLRELRFVLLRHRFQARTVEMLRGDFLPLRRVQIMQVFLGGAARALPNSSSPVNKPIFGNCVSYFFATASRRG